eukprot:TRINITY_DN34854_c0_g1_i1.p1 TRINITY_DN34854_c0_g1~~TRINITY_DN34854_c0_g1_i1.p1  ORF type:complete len:455 (-),score=93.84 TRINITY_DN34854_c0_g1_i1:86-1450(-)
MPDGSGWGLRLRSSASSGCKVGERLLRTPRTLLWEAKESQRPGCQAMVPGEELPGASQILCERLADAWMVESQGGSSQISKLRPLIRSLRPPTSLPLLLVAGSFDDEEISKEAAASLSGTIVLPSTEALRAALKKEVGRELLRSRQTASKCESLWKARLWAQSVVMSRAFKLPCPNGGERLVLAPMIDIANHSASRSEANAEIQDEKDGSISLMARQPFGPGEEIKICYGEYGNEQLLFCYGFIVADNPNSGPVCPIKTPDSGSRATLLNKCLELYRQTPGSDAQSSRSSRSNRSSSASKGQQGSTLKPRLMSKSRSEAAAGVADELLMAIRISAMSELEALDYLEKMELEPSNSQALSMNSRSIFPEPRPQDLVDGLELLASWKKELGSGRPKRVVESDSLLPAKLLQAEVKGAVEAAVLDTSARLPAPLRLRWFFQDLKASAIAHTRSLIFS